MNTNIIAVKMFSFGSFLQNQVLPKLLKTFRQHHIIYPYIEAVLIVCYRWAIWLNPSLVEAHYRLGQLFQKQHQWQKAATAFEQVTKIGSFELADAYGNLGRVLSKLKKYEESIAALHQAITLEPHHYGYYRFLGDTLSDKGKIDEAVNIYQIASQKRIYKTHPQVVLKYQIKKTLTAPNFMIIGQVKCGTSSLYRYLTQHPQILPAIKKEIQFWNLKSHSKRKLEWYLSHFPAISSEQNLITGEATPYYFNCQSTAKQVFRLFPNLKLIILLRNPIDQVVSHYYMKVRINREKLSLKQAIFSGLFNSIQLANSNLTNYCDNNLYLKNGIYIEMISEWMEIFPKNQFFIVKSEDLFADPATIVKQIFQFLEVEPYQLQEYSNSSRGNYPPLSQSMRHTLGDYFRPFNQQLEEYLDRKFNWDY